MAKQRLKNGALCQGGTGGHARVSAKPTLAAATASTSSFGSTLSGTVNDPIVKPEALAVTSMVFGAEDASPWSTVDERDAAPLPASGLTEARRARSAGVPAASTVTRTIARVRPW
jgi:hypothetical protein|eukprot:COSAG02_NODE_121_length_35326_cov_25.450819_13_plen_115_part_00